MQEPSDTPKAEHGVIEGREKCYMFLHEDGSVELWGSKNLTCVAVRVRKEVEEVDYCTTRNGLDYSGLRLVASEHAGPKQYNMEQLFHAAVEAWVMTGSCETRDIAVARAMETVVNTLRRRSPFLINSLSSPEIMREIRKEIERAELKVFDESMYTNVNPSLIRKKEHELSDIWP